MAIRREDGEGTVVLTTHSDLDFCEQDKLYKLDSRLATTQHMATVTSLLERKTYLNNGRMCTANSIKDQPLPLYSSRVTLYQVCVHVMISTKRKRYGFLNGPNREVSRI